MAMAAGQQATGGDPGEFPTAFGAAYNDVLRSVGAPSGIISSTPVGSLPPGWPGASGPQSAVTTTSTSINPLNPSTWFAGLVSAVGAQSLADLAERFGLILLGGILIIVAFIMLTGKSMANIGLTVAAPEAKVASTVTGG